MNHNVMGLFEQVLVGILAIGVLFLFWPGAKAAMKKNREAENPDWASALIPIGIVVLFIVFLIILARN
ncbi:MAG: hypothetical protein OXN26_00015 [Gammaproteobacteria bacterium]|nr:hypothetical protein [Gammaproteobacteria bacterium]